MKDIMDMETYCFLFVCVIMRTTNISIGNKFLYPEFDQGFFLSNISFGHVKEMSRHLLSTQNMLLKTDNKIDHE